MILYVKMRGRRITDPQLVFVPCDQIFLVRHQTATFLLNPPTCTFCSLTIENKEAYLPKHHPFPGWWCFSIIFKHFFISRLEENSHPCVFPCSLEYCAQLWSLFSASNDWANTHSLHWLPANQLQVLVCNSLQGHVTQYISELLFPQKVPQVFSQEDLGSLTVWSKRKDW